MLGQSLAASVMFEPQFTVPVVVVVLVVGLRFVETRTAKEECLEP
jgi:hypothetical protein